MVVLNYLHVSVIFNSGVFLLFSSQKCSVLGEGIQPLGLTFPGVLYLLTGLFGLQKYYDLACF